MPPEVQLTPAARRYLDAFDIWLHTVWKQPPMARPANNLATLRKDHALADLTGEPARDTSCRECGGAIARATGPGRPRKFCHQCRPPVRVAMAA